MAPEFHDSGMAAGDGMPLRLGYSEIAARLSLTPNGARALARRRGWPRHRDASGRVIVSIDEAELARLAEQHRAKTDQEAQTEPEIAADPTARIARLVAAIKAERDASEAKPAAEPSGEPCDGAKDETDAHALMRQLLAARDREKAGWARAMQQLASDLAEAKAAVATLKDDLARAAVEHRRAITELEASHSDQRSIWQLERRRLEITIDGFEKKRRKTWPSRLGLAKARPAQLIAVMVVAVAAMILAQDTALSRVDYTSRGFDDMSDGPGSAAVCTIAGDCTPLPEPVSHEGTKFLVEGFLHHMAQQLSLGANTASAADP